MVLENTKKEKITTIKHITNNVGMFKELPRKKDITDSDYESITNKSYFLRE